MAPIGHVNIKYYAKAKHIRCEVELHPKPRRKSYL